MATHWQCHHDGRTGGHGIILSDSGQSPASRTPSRRAARAAGLGTVTVRARPVRPDGCGPVSATGNRDNKEIRSMSRRTSVRASSRYHGRLGSGWTPRRRINNCFGNRKLGGVRSFLALLPAGPGPGQPMSCPGRARECRDVTVTLAPQARRARGAVTVTVTAARSCRDDSDDRGGLKY